MNLRIAYIFTIFLASYNIVFGGCPLAHTHIGINPTWRPDWTSPSDPPLATDTDPTDNNKLWFFSVPPVHPTAPTAGWPNWKLDNDQTFLRLTPVLEGNNPITKGDGSGKQLWTCNFMYSQTGGYGDPTGLQHLDGWHSAHGPQGKWNLASHDQTTIPAWQIGIRRESTSVEEDDFFMLLPNDTQVLMADNDTYMLNKQWLSDFNAWGIHEHMTFNFWLTPEIGQEVTATFSAFDVGGIYTVSDNFDFTFVTVPEPCSLLLIGTSIMFFVNHRNKKCRA